MSANLKVVSPVKQCDQARDRIYPEGYPANYLEDIQTEWFTLTSELRRTRAALKLLHAVSFGDHRDIANLYKDYEKSEWDKWDDDPKQAFGCKDKFLNWVHYYTQGGPSRCELNRRYYFPEDRAFAAHLRMCERAWDAIPEKQKQVARSEMTGSICFPHIYRDLFVASFGRHWAISDDYRKQYENDPDLVYNIRDNGLFTAADHATGNMAWRADPRDQLFCHDDPLQKMWCVEGRLPSDGKGLLYGPWGSYKTFVLLDLAAAIVLGRETWLGGKVRQGGVLLFVGERPQDIAKRLVPIGLKADGSMAFAFRPSCPQLLDKKARMDEQSVEQIIKIAREARDYFEETFNGTTLDLIGFDTLVRCAGFPLGAELDGGAVAEVMRAFDTINAELDTFCLATDHTGKDAARGPTGSARKADISDVMFELSKAPHKLIMRKVSDGEEGLEFPMALEVVDLGKNDSGIPVSTGKIVWGAQKARKASGTNRVGKGGLLLQSIMADDPDGTAETWRAAFYEKYPAKSQDAKQKAFRRAALEVGLEVE